jgi:hypothetical protein
MVMWNKVPWLHYYSCYTIFHEFCRYYQTTKLWIQRIYVAMYIFTDYNKRSMKIQFFLKPRKLVSTNFNDISLVKYVCFLCARLEMGRIMWLGMAGGWAGIHTGFCTITLVLYIGSLPNLATWIPCGRGRTLFILGSLGQRSRSPLL